MANELQEVGKLRALGRFVANPWTWPFDLLLAFIAGNLIKALFEPPVDGVTGFAQDVWGQVLQLPGNPIFQLAFIIFAIFAARKAVLDIQNATAKAVARQEAALQADAADRASSLESEIASRTALARDMKAAIESSVAGKTARLWAHDQELALLRNRAADVQAAIDRYEQEVKEIKEAGEFSSKYGHGRLSCATLRMAIHDKLTEFLPEAGQKFEPPSDEKLEVKFEPIPPELRGQPHIPDVFKPENNVALFDEHARIIRNYRANAELLDGVIQVRTVERDMLADEVRKQVRNERQNG